MPAISGPSARPSPPSITAAKTTPIQAYICEGVEREASARQTPATLASAAQVPASRSASAFWLTPKAEATGASSAAARIALPRSVKRSTAQTANESATASTSVMNSGTGKYSSPTLNLCCA